MGSSLEPSSLPTYGRAWRLYNTFSIDVFGQVCLSVTFYHRFFSRNGTHKAFTVSFQRERCCATFRISLQVRCMNLSSSSADLLQVILGLPRCLFPSGVQNKLSLATSPESFLNTCPIHVHFLRVRSTMMSSCLQMFRTSRLDIFCGHLMHGIMRRHLWIKTLSFLTISWVVFQLSEP